jgi:hypothetical protein
MTDDAKLPRSVRCSKAAPRRRCQLARVCRGDGKLRALACAMLRIAGGESC